VAWAELFIRLIPPWAADPWQLGAREPKARETSDRIAGTEKNENLLPAQKKCKLNTSSTELQVQELIGLE
jgi:hypothetical protein